MKTNQNPTHQSKKSARILVLVFGVWALIVSGVFAGFVGSPGVIQALRLQSLLASKQDQVHTLQTELARLQLEESRLQKTSASQEREIRKVLGYAAPDELIFDFTPAGQLD